MMTTIPLYDSPLFNDLNEIHGYLEAVLYLLHQRAVHDEQGEHFIALLSPISRCLEACLEQWEIESRNAVTQKEGQA